MILQMCTIYDKRAENFGPPMCFPTLGVAERHFSDSVNDPNNVMYKHPSDFELWAIGEWDTDTGCASSQPHKIIGVAQQFKILAN